jgi:flavin reductase
MTKGRRAHRAHISADITCNQTLCQGAASIPSFTRTESGSKAMAAINSPSVATQPPDKDEFRAGMSRLGAAVNIITTNGPGGRAGFTASAVCSVTDSPPTLLVCLNRSASVYEAFAINSTLCVNTLSPGHVDLSRLFGGKTPVDERFAAASWTSNESGSLILDGAAVAFDCRVTKTADVGSHTVFFCEVVAIAHNEEADGLIYFDHAYHRVQCHGRVP